MLGACGSDGLQQLRGQPNEVTYSAVVSALCSPGYVSARAVPGRALQLHQLQQQRVQPNEVTYSAVISAHVKTQMAERAVQLFGAMRQL